MSTPRQIFILVLDDDPYLASTMASSLRRRFPAGTVIRIAHSLKEAMDYVNQERYHAVVADYELPDGKGLDLIKSLLTTRGTPTAMFLISGLDPDKIGVASLMKEHPEITFIEKPFRYPEVVERILHAVVPQPTTEQNFYGLRLFELIQAYSLSNHSVTLRVLMPNGKMGTAALRDGQLVHAAIDRFEGQEALLVMAQNKKGEIRVEKGCPTAKQTITKPTQQVLIDTFRLLDEQTNPGRTQPNSESGPVDFDALFDDAFNNPNPR